MQEYFPAPRLRASVFTPSFWEKKILCVGRKTARILLQVSQSVLSADVLDEGFFDEMQSARHYKLYLEGSCWLCLHMANSMVIFKVVAAFSHPRLSQSGLNQEFIINENNLLILYPFINS